VRLGDLSSLPIVQPHLSEASAPLTRFEMVFFGQWLSGQDGRLISNSQLSLNALLGPLDLLSS
jgi:hypothetical protein